MDLLRFSIFFLALSSASAITLEKLQLQLKPSGPITLGRNFTAECTVEFSYTGTMDKYEVIYMHAGEVVGKYVFERE